MLNLFHLHENSLVISYYPHGTKRTSNRNTMATSEAALGALARGGFYFAFNSGRCFCKKCSCLLRTSKQPVAILKRRIGNGGGIGTRSSTCTSRLLQQAKEKREWKAESRKNAQVTRGGKYRATHNGTVRTYPPPPNPKHI